MTFKKPGAVKKKKKSKVRPRRTKAPAVESQNEPAIASLNPLRTGMPALDSITGVQEFRKGDKVYRLIETNEVDEYEGKTKSHRQIKTRPFAHNPIDPWP